MKRWNRLLASGNGRSILGGLALIVVLVLMPDIAPPTYEPEQILTVFRGRIESFATSTPSPGSEIPPTRVANVRALDGERAGQLVEAYMTAPGGSQIADSYRAGDEVVVTVTETADGQPFIAVSDRWRLPWLQVFGVIFAAAVIAVGGWHGLRALVALGLTVAVILKLLLPLLIIGVAPVPLAVLTAASVTVLTILLTEGWRRSSFAAILGTTAALALTGMLAAAATSVMDFTYAAGSDLGFLATQGGQGLDLRGVLLAAFILGAVGVLDDVTVTQAALVEELSRSGGLAGRALFTRAMGVGRSHIAATVNTLFLAYVGAGLPLLVVLLVSQQPTALVANQEVIATEVARTVVGSLGIVAAVPFTTFVATLIGGHATGTAAGWSRSSSASVPILAIVAGIAALLLATAVLPLAGGTRAPFEEPVFVPGSSAPRASPVAAETDSADRGDPVVLEVGQPMPITLDGLDVGTVTVDEVARVPAQGVSGSPGVVITVRYEAIAPFDLTAGYWELLLTDGAEFPLDPVEGRGVLGQTLDAGESLVVTLEARLDANEAEPFLLFVDRLTTRFVFAVALA